MEDTPLWRAVDLAEVYGVDESTVHRWERDGKLRRARRDPGGCKYWLRDEVLGDLSEGRQDAAPETQPVVAVPALVAATRRPHGRRRAS